MTDFNIYLAGACKNLDWNTQNIWRDVSKEKLERVECNYHVYVSNPNDYFNYIEERHKSQKQVKEFFLHKIRTSNLVLCNLNYSNSSVGTGQELQFARDNNVPIIGFGNEEVYPWLVEDCQVVFDTLEEALKYISDYYLK